MVAWPIRVVGGHLSAGHAVNRVVDEDDADALAAVGRVHDLGHADGSQVAVALVAEHEGVLSGVFGARGHGGRAAVRGFHAVHLQVVVNKHRAAHGTNADGLVQQAHFHQAFRHQAVRDAVMAARAIVRGPVDLPLAQIKNQFFSSAIH